MKIVWFTPELGNFSSGIINHNNIFISYLKNHPEVEEISVVKFPFPENKLTPPFLQELQGIRYYTPRFALDYREAFKSILQADLKLTERLKVKLFKLVLQLKGVKQFDLANIKKWGKLDYGVLGIAAVQKPFPNPVQNQIGRCIAKLHPDIIQSHVELFSIAGSLAKSVAKGHISYQIIVEEERKSLPPRSIMSVFWDRLDEGLQWLIEHKAVDKFVAASDYIKKTLVSRGVQEEQIGIIPSPIIMKLFNPLDKAKARSLLGIPQSKRVILSVGRVIERKRFIDIIRILKNLPEDVLFYFKRSISSSDDILPSELNNLKKEVQKLKLGNRVIINSEVIPYERMREIYSAADVAVFPFLYEPFGMCALEAIACERPLIVYNSGFLPNFIDGNGFIVESLNLKELENKIRILLNDPLLANQMGAKGPDLAKKFDIQILGEKLMNIYREFA